MIEIFLLLLQVLDLRQLKKESFLSKIRLKTKVGYECKHIEMSYTFGLLCTKGYLSLHSRYQFDDIL